ncbi:MAG: MFS transporter [Xenococcaceae cyanobacterium]
MRIFLLIWLGQIVSLVGSALTEFALGVWVYQKTGSVTQFALISLFIYLPKIIISPLAGALVDRWDRRWAMILSDFVAGLSTLMIMVLVLSDSLEIWHIYLAVVVNSIFNAFQWPAYAAATTQLVPKQHLGRANGMVQASRATAKLLSPAMAGFLVGIIQIQGILLIDYITFVFALVTLLSIRFPKNTSINHTHHRKASIRQLLREILSGWHYIAFRQGLLALLMLFAVIYFTEGMIQVLFWPLVLNLGSSAELGIVLSIAGCGMLLGSVVMSTWGGPKRRVHGILFFVSLQGILLCLGGLKPSISVAAVGGFGYLFAYPIIVSCNRTIWQSKVPLNLQGRVFALQLMLEKSLAILAYIFTGPLVDHIFEPLLATDGLLTSSIGKIIGVGPGRGIGLLFILIGMLNILATIVSCRSSRLLRVEKELPDAMPAADSAKAEVTSGSI